MRTICAIAAVTLTAACSSGPSADAVCKHVVELFKKEGMAETIDPAKCREGFAKIQKEHGAEVAAAVGKCTLAAKAAADLKACRPDTVKASSKGSSGSATDTYVNKSKATEAKQFVKKMYDGARAYYMEEHVGDSMTPTPPQFPAPGVGPTPPLGTCCKAGGKCAPDAAQWTAPAWVALMFSVDDPHYYSYEYKVAEDKKSFTALAYGDLDCDGEYSTYMIKGAADLQGPGELEIERELE